MGEQKEQKHKETKQEIKLAVERHVHHDSVSLIVSSCLQVQQQSQHQMSHQHSNLTTIYITFLQLMALSPISSKNLQYTHSMMTHTLTCPSLPIFTGLFSFHGFFKSWHRLNARVPLYNRKDRKILHVGISEEQKLSDSKKTKISINKGYVIL